MTQPLPPGWYADPHDPSRNQFWDGTTWNRYGPPVDYPPDPPPRRPPKQRNALVVAGWMFLALIIGVVGMTWLGWQAGTDPTASTTTRTASPPTTRTTATSPSATYLDRSTYQNITQRAFLILLKDPDSHIGERIVVYGKVAQFDTKTGASTFRAPAMGEPHNPPGENAIFTAPNPAILTNVVEGDSLTMYVEVTGTTSYQSQIGGSVTAPTFNVYIVEPFKLK